MDAIFINLPTGYGKSLIYQYELANVVNCFWLVVCCTCGRIVGPIISYIRRTSQRNNPRSARVFSSVASIIYNPGKNLVDFLNFQTLSPSPLIQCWYLGNMCCKSTLSEPTLFGGGGEGRDLRKIVALIEKCSHFDHMFSNLSVYFEKSTHIFSKIV